MSNISLADQIANSHSLIAFQRTNKRDDQLMIVTDGDETAK
jgi:hypothetical protein